MFSQAKLNLIPSLKTIEPYKLEALIIEDIKHNGQSKMADIQARLSEVYPADIQKSIYKMVKGEKLIISDSKKNRKYSIAKKK